MNLKAEHSIEIAEVVLGRPLPIAVLGATAHDPVAATRSSRLAEMPDIRNALSCQKQREVSSRVEG